MISQIGFLVKASLKTGMKSAAAYAVGVTLGALGLGACLGGVGATLYWLFGKHFSYSSREVGLVMSGLCILGALVDGSVLPCPILGPKTQLPRHYMQILGPTKTGFLWGLSVGFAKNTRFGYFIYCIIGLWAFLSGSPLIGAIIMGLYGLAQGMLLVLEIFLIGISEKFNDNDGLLGYNRSTYFYYVSSFCLMAAGIANVFGWAFAGPGGK